MSLRRIIYYCTSNIALVFFTKFHTWMSLVDSAILSCISIASLNLFLYLDFRRVWFESWWLLLSYGFTMQFMSFSSFPIGISMQENV